MYSYVDLPHQQAYQHIREGPFKFQTKQQSGINYPAKPL